MKTVGGTGPSLFNRAYKRPVDRSPDIVVHSTFTGLAYLSLFNSPAILRSVPGHPDKPAYETHSPPPPTAMISQATQRRKARVWPAATPQLEYGNEVWPLDAMLVRQGRYDIEEKRDSLPAGIPAEYPSYVLALKQALHHERVNDNFPRMRTSKRTPLRKLRGSTNAVRHAVHRALTAPLRGRRRGNSSSRAGSLDSFVVVDWD